MDRYGASKMPVGCAKIKVRHPKKRLKAKGAETVILNERMIAVAVRDGADLFLWLRIRRSKNGDIFYMFPTGRTDKEWKKWDPHGSLHKDGRLHHKSYDKKFMSAQHQKPDANFKGTTQLVTRPIASDEPRKFNVVCDPDKFTDMMEIPVGLLSPKKYETNIAVDVTEPGGKAIITVGAEIVDQKEFKACGGRLDRVTARRLSVQMLQNGIREGTAPTTYVPPISHAIAAERTGCDEGHR